MAYSAAESTICLYSVVSAKFTGPLFKIPTVLFYIEHLYNTLNLFLYAMVMFLKQHTE